MIDLTHSFKEFFDDSRSIFFINYLRSVDRF